MYISFNIYIDTRGIVYILVTLKVSYLPPVSSLARCPVGAGKPSTGESMEEDDMVMRVGNSLSQRRTDEGGRVASPKDL